MRGDELLDALEHLDADLIVKADAPVPKRRISYRSAAIAAVLVLVIGIGTILGGKGLLGITGPALLESSPSTTCSCRPSTSTSAPGPTLPVPPDNLIHISPAEIASMFPNISGSISDTKHYMSISVKELYVQPIQWTPYLPIYQDMILENCEDPLLSFIHEIYPLFADENTPPPSEYAIEKNEGSYYWQTQINNNRFRCIFTGQSLNAILDPIYDPDYLGPVLINGKSITFDSKDDEQIAEELSEWIDNINLHSGRNFAIYEIFQAKEDVIIVELSCASDPCDYMQSDKIRLDFWQYSQNDPYRLESIQYIRSVNDWGDYFPVTGQSPMITLEEAEALLEKGCTFGYQICSCGLMASGKELDFSEYDMVELRWGFGMNSDRILPFYVFYKKIYYNEEDQRIIYANAYVPAIEVAEMEEFFSSIEELHNAHYFL